MTKRKSLTIPIVWVAAVIGIIQSILWIGLSVAGICIGDIYEKLTIDIKGIYVDEDKLTIFLYAYAALDLTWFVFSCVLIKGVLSNHMWSTNRRQRGKFKIPVYYKK